MKIEKNSYELLDSVSLSKRLFSGFIDFVLLILLEFVFFLGVCHPIIKTIPSYQEYDSIRENEMNTLFSYSIEAKLLKEENGKILNENEMFQRFVYKEVLLSFNENKDYFLTNDISSINNPYQVEMSSPSNNELIYFYVIYAKDNNLIDYKGMDPLDYYIDVIGSSNSILSYYEINESNFPVLKPSLALSYYKEIENNKREELQSFYSFYDSIFQSSSKILMNEEKYKMHYEIYEDAYYKSISYLAVGVLIAHLVTYLIIYLIFPLFVFKYNMTLGRRIFKIVTFKDNDDISIYMKLVISLVFFFLSYFSIFFSFGFFFGLNFINAPLFTLFNLNISNSLFALISLLIFVINYVFVFGRNNQSLADRLLDIEMKDANHFVSK